MPGLVPGIHDPGVRVGVDGRTSPAMTPSKPLLVPTRISP